MSITTTIPAEFWLTLVHAIWWGVIAGVAFKGLSWLGYACAAMIKADAAGSRK